VTGRIVSLEPDPHVAVQSLLPWYATGRLEADEKAHVEAHLAQCEECRAELAAERQWKGLQVATGAQVDVEAGWSAMLARLNQGDAERVAAHAAQRAPRDPRPPLRMRRPAGWAAAGPLLRWGWIAPTAAAAVALLVIGLQAGAGRDAASGRTVLAANDGATYQALAATPAPTATALVRFRPDATEAQVRAVLQRFDARVVDGPTASAAWVIRLPREHYADTLAALRAQPPVTLAEALESEAGR
jgi:hypothetical protein